MVVAVAAEVARDDADPRRTRIASRSNQPSACASNALLGLGAPSPLRYTGLVDSHPYGIASLGGNAWAVADAGGNDIVGVAANGDLSTIAVAARRWSGGRQAA